MKRRKPPYRGFLLREVCLVEEEWQPLHEFKLLPNQPSHKPSIRTKAMCEIAGRLGMGYYSALNGDHWSPDLPGLTKSQIEQRLEGFSHDCAYRGLTDWEGEARSLGYDLDSFSSIFSS